MVKYNRGRFIFKFSPEDKNLCAVFDSKYEAEYIIGHIAFEQVFEMAVKSLDDESAKELEKRLKGEPRYSKVIQRMLYKRKYHK